VSQDREQMLQELLELGRLGLETGYWAEAEAYYERALRIAPGHPEALLGRAHACRDARRALDAVRALLAIVPDSEEGLRMQGELLQRMQDPSGAPEGRSSDLATGRAAPPGARRSRVVALGVGAALILLAALALSVHLGLLPGPLARTAPGATPETTLSTGWMASVTLSADADALARAFGATVLILSPDPSGVQVQQGSGVVVDERGIVLTNHHVLADGQRNLLNGDGLAFIGFTYDVRRPPDEWYIGAAVALDPERDLAALRILSTAQGRSVQGQVFPPILPRDSGDLALGDALIGLGYPALGGETVTLTRGSMAGFAYAANGMRLGKTDSELLPGSSGGAVLDAQGHLAGIITATVTEARTQGRLSYFVLIDEAAGLLASARQAPHPGPSLRWMRDLFQEWALAR